MAHALTTKDFIIIGPALVRGNRVLEAVQALYYLPDNFKLIFTDNLPMDMQIVNEVLSLAHRNELAQRVHFNSQPKPGAVIASHASTTLGDNVVSGETPEALASAILKLARAA